MTTGLLPKFDHPPVVEVALSIQFEGLGVPGSVLAFYWETIHESFPYFEEQPQLSPISEDFGPPRPQEFSVELVDRPPSPRLWLISEDQSRLLQLQSDRIAYNWRRRDEEAPYPHYEAIRAELDHHWEGIRALVSKKGGGPLTPTWCEVAYVNVIRTGKNWTNHSQLAQVLRLSSEAAFSFLPAPDDQSATARFTLRSASGSPYGRLVAVAEPAFDSATLSPVLRLTLTARGFARGDGELGELGFLETARTWIVEGFADLTTEAMHEEWGRTQ